MSYTVQELNPSNILININNKVLELDLITLHKQVEFAEEYGDIRKAFEILNIEKTRIIDIIWLLLKDKSIFNLSIADFKKFLFNGEENTVSWAKKMKAGLDEVLKKSMPLIKNPGRQKDINRIKQAQTENGGDGTPCYAVYYDSIASRYGTSLDDFYKMTLRQIHMLLRIIGDARYKELEVEAALAGKKLKPRVTYNDNISVEEEAKQDEDAMDALKRLQQKYKEQNKGK